MAAQQPLVLARRCRFHRVDARSREQRERDDGNLPQLEIDDAAHARCRIDPPLHGAKADREPVDRAGGHQREQRVARIERERNAGQVS